MNIIVAFIKTYNLLLEAANHMRSTVRLVQPVADPSSNLMGTIYLRKSPQLLLYHPLLSQLACHLQRNSSVSLLLSLTAFAVFFGGWGNASFSVMVGELARY
jgi:hypothetical protein